jgi:hypothetical protein
MRWPGSAAAGRLPPWGVCRRCCPRRGDFGMTSDIAQAFGGAGATAMPLHHALQRLRPFPESHVRTRLSAGGRWIRTSGTADDARLLADLYAHNASRQMPQKGSSDQAVACLRRLGAGVVGSAAVCAFRFRPPGTGSKRAGWRRSGAIFAFFGAVCFEPDASRARLRFRRS